MTEPTPPTDPTPPRSPVPPAAYAVLALIAVLGVGLLLWARHRHRVAAEADAAPGVITAKGHTLGSVTAPVTIVEFADFECPACGRFANSTEPQMRQEFVTPGRAKVTLYDIALPMHHNAAAASMAAACAEDQGVFWPMHDLLYRHQDQWNSEATKDPGPVFRQYADSLKLSRATFDACLASGQHRGLMDENWQAARTARIRGTPTFRIGGHQLIGNVPIETIRAYVDTVTAEQKGAAASTGGAAPAKG